MKYGEKGEPGTYQGKEHLRWKAQAGEPTTKESRLRRQCNPHGPIGLLLESIHLQASSLDEKGHVKHWNQMQSNLEDTPYQHLKPILRQAAARNRTIAAEGMRNDTEGLREIDKHATQGDCKDLSTEDLATLNIIRTASTWTQATTF